MAGGEPETEDVSANEIVRNGPRFAFRLRYNWDSTVTISNEGLSRIIFKPNDGRY